MFGPITIPYEAVMLYNVCRLKDGVHWSDDLEFAIGEMCTVVKETYDEFIAGQVLKYAGFVSKEGTVGSIGEEKEHVAIITYWKSFEQHEVSHMDSIFLDKFSSLMEMCTEKWSWRLSGLGQASGPRMHS